MKIGRGSHNFNCSADDPRTAKLLIVLQYVEGGPVMRLDPAADSPILKLLAEPAARRFFRDVLQVC